jgi:CO/xanthine dehydrogenase Mo-binding subunit
VSPASILGSNLPRVDGFEKVTGQAQFAGDLVVPGMLHGRLLRSHLAHARIVGIDTRAAERLPGVAAVLTGADVAHVNAMYGHAIKDRPLIAIDRVRFAGEPVVAVAAEDEHIAHEALGLIEVEYEELPVAATLDSALADDAPQLHDLSALRVGLFHGLGEFKVGPGNMCYHHSFQRGDTAGLLSQADILVEGEYVFPAVYQYAMEPHTVIAHHAGRQITVWASCQHPFLVRAELADLFGLPVANVRVVVPYLGGGFGSKSYTKMEPITVALARKAGRPVRVANRVDEAMVTTRRHNMKCWMRTAATREGRLLARQVRIWLDTGAYADNGPRVVATAADAAPGPYRWDGVQVDAWGVYTNTPPAGSYRAFGATHLAWIGESQVDEVARRAGVDRIEIRVQNLLRPGEPVRPGGKPLDADLVGDVQTIARLLDWQSPKAPDTGRGMGVALLAAGAHPVSSAVVRLEADGSAVLLVSSTEMGQGVRTVFSQLVGHELGLPIENVRVVGGDTQVTPYDRSTGASRSTTLAGLAVQRAAADVRQQVLQAAGDVWRVSPTALDVSDGRIWHAQKSMTYAELCLQYFGLAGGEFIGQGRVQPEFGRGSYAAGPVFWEVCIGGAEIRLDRDTGRIHVKKLVSVADVGQALNPRLVEAQEMGGALQGLGNALFEEMLFDNGQLLNSSLLDYHIPSMADMPDAFVSALAENEDGPGPYGAKGVGEGSLAGVPAAIVNALGDLGIGVHELPVTPERVWRALQSTAPPGGKTNADS